LSHVNFTGSPGRMVVNGYKGVTGDNPRSISFWYNSNSTAPNSKGNGTICYWGDEGSDPLEGTQWRIDTVGSPSRIQVSARGTFKNSSMVVEDGTWHNVTINFPGGADANCSDCDIYIDGILDDEGRRFPPVFSVEPATGISTTVGVDLIIGSRPEGAETVVGTGIPLAASGFANFFEGGIDNFAIWSGTLGASGISTITGSLDADLSTVPDGTLELWLRMGDVGGDTAGAAGTIQDSSGNGRDATTTAGTTISG
jgi:hypothetical protein